MMNEKWVDSHGYTILKESAIYNKCKIILSHQQIIADQYWVYMTPTNEDLWFINSNVSDLDEAKEIYEDYLRFISDPRNLERIEELKERYRKIKTWRKKHD